MEESEFWQLIDDVHEKSDGDMDTKCAILGRRLTKLSEEELADFDSWFHTWENQRLYRWDLWAAAHIIHGGCSDDKFSDFRSGLISLGQQTVLAALHDVQSLVDIADAGDGEPAAWTDYEGYQYVAGDVYEQRGLAQPGTGVEFLDEPAGDSWDEDGVRELYPKLSARFQW